MCIRDSLVPKDGRLLYSNTAATSRLQFENARRACKVGQKIHPIGFRIGIIRGWDSRWFTKKNFADCIYEDSRIRQFIGTQFKHASISAVEI